MSDAAVVRPAKVSSSPRVHWRRWWALVGGLGLMAAGRAIAAEWGASPVGVAEVWSSTLARLDAVPLQERYWVLVLAGVLSLVFTGQRGRGRSGH